LTYPVHTLPLITGMRLLLMKRFRKPWMRKSFLLTRIPPGKEEQMRTLMA